MPPARRGRPAIRRLAPSPTPGPGPAPAPAPSQDDLFRQFMQAYMEDRRNPVPPEAREPRENASDRPLKARNPDLYYGNLHMECYYFCQQCEDHFKTVGAKGHKRVSFAASFLKDRILFRWQQHKNRIKRDRAASPSWEEYKAFLRRSLGESTTFVDNI